MVMLVLGNVATALMVRISMKVRGGGGEKNNHKQRAASCAVKKGASRITDANNVSKSFAPLNPSFAAAHRLLVA